MCDQARIPLHPNATLHLPLFHLKRRLESAHSGLLLPADIWQVASGPRWALQKPHPCSPTWVMAGRRLRAPPEPEAPQLPWNRWLPSYSCVHFGRGPAIISLQVWRTLYVWSFWTILRGKWSLKPEIPSWITFHQKDARHRLRANEKAGSIFKKQVTGASLQARFVSRMILFCHTHHKNLNNSLLFIH